MPAKTLSMVDPWDTLKLLSDSTRLRVLLLLSEEELSVAELQEILDMGQSRISSHLALLRQNDLVRDRKEGKRTYYSLSPNLPAESRQLLEAARSSVAEETAVQNDRALLQKVLDQRLRESERYFNEVAGRLGKNYCPGRSWEALGHFLLRLTPHIDIADLGAGEGVLSQLLAQRARSVICIDKAPAMVEFGRKLAADHNIANLEYRLGDIEKVPIDDNSIDLAILSQALHHSPHPTRAIKEAFRILRPGGQIIIIDLKEHQFEKARELYADLWLGFKENTIYQYLRDTGFEDVDVSIVAKEAQEPFFETILAAAIKPA